MQNAISKTLLKVINEQSLRLGQELKKKYGEEQAQFLSKHSVAKIYGFDHWCNMIHFINSNKDPLSHEDFRDVDLHPKNINFQSPEFINFWEIKKERISEVLNIKPSNLPESPVESYTGDEISNYLAKMYGFKSMSELWTSLKYHFEYEGKYYSIFDQREKELFIHIDFEPKNSEFIQDIIINHLNFGSTYFVGPKEWFKYEFDYSSVKISDSYKNKDSFYGWTVKRMTNLFLNDIKSKFGNYVTTHSAKNLLETIIPILMFDNHKSGYPINMHSFCEILKLKSLLLIVGDNHYPKALQFLVKEYLESIGHDFKNGYSSLNKQIQKKHDNGAMLISHSIFTLSSLFEHTDFSISEDLIILDAESIGYFSKFEQKILGINVSNEIINDLSIMDEKSMVVLFDDLNNPVDENYIDPIRDYCKLKNMLFVLLSNNKENKYGIKNYIEIKENAEISSFILGD